MKFEHVLNPKFWQTICPELTITENTPLSGISSFGDEIEIRQDAWETCKSTIHRDAYFVYDSYFHPDLIDRLAGCLRAIDEAGYPVVFCFVYDEFWQLLLQLDPLLSDLLDDYQLLPAVWTWFVRHDNQTAFAPHRDGVRDVSVDDDEHLDYLTIWIPLTDLNHLSSSISILPASVDPDYDKGTSEVRVKNLQDVKSLQAKKGSVLCWTIGLAHWGTCQSEWGEPRMSVGYFVQHEDADCLVPPPLDFDQPFTLLQRIALIGQQILDYSRDADPSLLEFAERLAASDERSTAPHKTD